MATFDLMTLIITFAVTLIFTLIAVNNREKGEYHYKLFAAVCWFIFSVVFFIVGQDGGGLAVYALTFLWMGLGLLFTVMGIQDFFNMKKDKIWGFDE
jgi:dipeptide/tripeptide permease